MTIASVTSKHQISIPAEVRRSLNLHKGDRLSFELAEDGACIVRKVTLRKSDGAARPYLEPGRQTLSDESMQRAVAEGALASYQRRKE